MKINRLSLLAGAGLGVLVASIGLSSTAFATPVAGGGVSHAALPLASTALQASNAQTVADFLSSTSEPAMPATSASAAAQNSYWQAEAEYWNAVPWASVAGQWGCTLQSVNVTRNAPDADGVASAGYGTVTNCGGAVGTAVTSAASLPMAKAELVQLNPSLGTQEGRVAQSRLAVASPQAAAYTCPEVGTANICVNGDSGGSYVSAQITWRDYSTTTGRARLGQVTPGAKCAAGTQKAISKVGTGGYGAVFTATTTTNMSTQWSSEYLLGSGTSVYGRSCRTL